MFELAYLRLRNKFDKEYLWKRYSKKCKELGMSNSILVLSFDCDTHEDAEVVQSLHQDLQNLGVKSSFAVPGEILRKNLVTYKSLANHGCEFLNHGEKEHTVFNKKTGHYESTFFYHDLSEQQVLEDVSAGHETLKKFLGFSPLGWRTPHFGTFQKKRDLERLYGQLKKLNYGYSTSRVPSYAFSRGPIVSQKKYSLVEIPVTGTTEYPFTILDSWRYFASPYRNRGPSDYLNECIKIAEIARNIPILINIYADPSHVSGNREFLEGIREICKHAKSSYFKEIV